MCVCVCVVFNARGRFFFGAGRAKFLVLALYTDGSMTWRICHGCLVSTGSEAGSSCILGRERRVRFGAVRGGFYFVIFCAKKFLLPRAGGKNCADGFFVGVGFLM